MTLVIAASSEAPVRRIPVSWRAGSFEPHGRRRQQSHEIAERLAPIGQCELAVNVGELWSERPQNDAFRRVSLEARWNERHPQSCCGQPVGRVQIVDFMSDPQVEARGATCARNGIEEARSHRPGKHDERFCRQRCKRHASACGQRVPVRHRDDDRFVQNGFN
jgi:hypothetical protein